MVRFYRKEVCFIIFEIFVWTLLGTAAKEKNPNLGLLLQSITLALKIPPEIRIIAKNGEFTKTIYDLQNTETVLSPTYFDAKASGWKRSITGNYDKNKYKPEWISFIYFECTAFYPVEWVYRGLDGWKLGRGASPDRAFNAQKILSRSLRVSEDFNGTSTSLYMAQIGQLNLFEIMTGNYTCRSVENADMSSFFYTFVPRNTKLGEKDIPLKTFLLDTHQTIRANKNAASIRLPCTVSNPDTTVTLKKRRKDGQLENIIADSSAYYDPKIGFILNLLKLKNPWGTYICKEETTKTSLAVTIIPHKEDEVRIIPNQAHVPMKSDRLEMFECKAKEKILISMDARDVKLNVEYKTNLSSSEKFPYKAIAKIIPSQLRKNYTAVKCISSETQRILHTWEFSKHGNNTIKITYDSRNRQFLCCTDSFHSPKFNMVFCGSDLECWIKKGYSVVNQNAYSTKHFAPQGCASIPVNIEGFGELRKSITRWPSPVVEGVLQCTVGIPGSDFRRETPFFHNQLTKYTTFHMGNPIPAGAQIMGIRQELAPHNKLVGDIFVGDTVRFICYAPSRYFATGPTFFTSEVVDPPPFYVYKWAIQKKNGSFRYLSSEDCFYDFCDITFADKNTTGVACFAPLKNSAIEFRNFTLHVKVKDRPEILQTRIVMTNLEGVLKVINSNHNATVVLNDTALGDFYEPAINKIVLECSAPYHVKWKYEGSGTPYIKSHYRRDADSIKATYSYNFTAKLEFVKLDENSTGKYICFSTESPKDLNAYFDIYVPGDHLFLSSSDKVINLYADSMTEKVRLLTIPCAVSDPYNPVQLYTVEVKNNSWVQAPKRPSMSFDPHRGFIFKGETFESLLGYYYCGDKLQRASTVISVQNGKAFPKYEARHSPGWTSRRIKELTWNYTEIFRCEATENITFAFSGEGQRQEVAHYMNISSDFPYIANFTVDLKDFLNFTQIQCVTAAEERLVHSWKVTIDGYFADRRFYFNETLNSYICCKGMPNPNPMEFVPCTSNTECKINKACMNEKRCSHLTDAKLKNSQNETDIPDLGRGCTAFNINFYPSGLLRCNDEEYFYFQENYEECDFECSSFDEPRYQPFIKSTDVLGITRKPKGRIVLGSPVRFDCFGSKFFFSGGFKWALSDQAGSLQFINGTESDEGSIIHSWTDVSFPDKSTQAVFCFAPEWNSPKNWKNSPISIEYY